MGQKILVAVDESENALRAVKYIADSFAKDSRVTLFSVVPDTAVICHLDEPSLHPLFKSHQAVFCVIDEKKKELLGQVMEQARDLLIKAGFSPEQVQVKVQTQKKGVARDIVDEAGAGYTTIVLGRRGLTGFQEFFLGSVSQKVLHAAKDISVVLVN